ncbi:MAG: sensor histidine kinase [Cyclobacteriaceae bacterium]
MLCLSSLAQVKPVVSRVQIDSLITVGFDQIEFNYQKSLDLLQSALILSKAIGYDWGVAEANRGMGFCHWRHSYYDVAKEHYQIASQLFKNQYDTVGVALVDIHLGMTSFYLAELDDAVVSLTNGLSKLGDTLFERKAYAHSQLGLVLSVRGDFELSNHHFIEGIKLSRSPEMLGAVNSTGLTIQKSNVYADSIILNEIIPDLHNEIAQSVSGSLEVGVRRSVLSGLYATLGQMADAITSSRLALEIFKNHDETARAAKESMKLGKYLTDVDDYQNAQSLLLSAVSLCIRSRIHPQLASSIQHLAEVHEKLKQIDSAIYYYLMVFQLSDTLGHKMDVSRYALTLSKVYLSSDEFDRAEFWGKIAHEVATDIGSFTHLMNAEKQLYEISKRKGFHDLALPYFESYHEKLLKIEDARLARSNLEYRMKYQQDKQIAEIAQLNLEKSMMAVQVEGRNQALLFMSLSVAILLAFVLLLRSKHIESKRLNAIISSQNKSNELLLKEIHHRVKNNLQMISSMLNLQRRRSGNKDEVSVIDITRGRVKSIGLVHELLYQHDNLGKADLKEYVEVLVDSVIETAQKNDQISVSCDVDNIEISYEILASIGLILNELLINTMKYGCDPAGCEISVSVKVVENQVCLNVSDNGPGAEKFEFGFGWTIIRSILKSYDDGEFSVSHQDGFTSEISFSL